MSWGTKPMLCPNCGRPPKLVREYFYSGSREGALYRFRYECRRWLGFLACRVPDDYAWISKEWADLGKYEAARKWNEHGTQR